MAQQLRCAVPKSSRITHNCFVERSPTRIFIVCGMLLVSLPEGHSSTPS